MCGNCIFYPMGPDGPPKWAERPAIKAQTRSKDPGCDLFDAIPYDEPTDD